MPYPPAAPPPAPARGARLRAALPLLWAVLLLYLTLAPLVRLPPTPEWKLLSFDTFAHGAFFAVQAALTWLWARRQTRRPRLVRHATLAVLLGCTLFGALIEVLQMSLPFNRHGEWSDLISDCLGAAAALGLLGLAAGPLRRRGWAIGLLLAISLPPASARSQDMPRARATIAKLASPGLHGRGYVQQGEHKAAAYLRGRLRNLGLQPLAPDYTQPFELDVNTFPGEVRLSRAYYRMGHHLTDDELRPGIDFIAAPESGSAAAFSTASALRLDTLVFSQVATQISVQRTAQGLLRDFAVAQKARILFQDFLRQAPAAAKPIFAKPFLVLTAREEQRLATLPAPIRATLDSLSNRIVLAKKLTASLAPIQASAIRFVALDSSRIWNLQDQPHAKTGALSFEIDAQLQRRYLTQNLAALIRGRTQPDSFLVITAHYDHLGMMGRKTYFPGANDNASGVALLLELAAYYAQPENRPACSIAFLLFGAEEAGLVGSRYFVQHPLVPLKQIKFLLNLDLLGTGEEGATVVNGRVHEAAFQQLQMLNTAGHYLPSLAARGRAANSDHFPFSEAGVPAFFLYTRGGSKAYHDVNDTPDKLSLAGFAGAFGLVRDFLNARQPTNSLPPR